MVDVYQQWGITGRGTVVSILDDGIEKDHPDLVKNYVRMLLIILYVIFRPHHMHSIDVAYC